MNAILSRPSTTTRSRRRTTAAACLMALSVVLTATACSGDSGGTGTKGAGSASDTEKTAEDQALEHRKCLREQGLNVPEPKPGSKEMSTIDGGGKTKAEMEKAFKTCQDKSPNGGPKELSQAEKDKMLAFARCMREKGIDMPDPKFEGGAMAAAPALKPGDMKKFEKANAACESAGR
ncbi:hypothetical protein EES43_16545 [Streptomyces sp. ADI96-02]|uniref:hypothetical protein n=1 Tax=Streptomyces sp. ADI96-02 TaxID=1522760 RepID=UPI000F5514CD|nr:hypothetical protein [Streptomyces sp. ADI96-02]RPK60860.1 hypothetical protein EES43_16545 [Streptomyces sp. ADI96-02]